MDKTLTDYSKLLQTLDGKELEDLELVLLNKAKQKVNETELNDYSTWARAVWLNSRGEYLDFSKHKYLVGIYADQHPQLVYQKAAQMGLSERLLSEAVWVCDRLGKNTLYTFPTSAQLSDFVQARLEPVFVQSDYLSRITGILSSEEKKERHLDESKKVQKVGLKQIRNNFMYLRGSQNEQQIISIDADCFDDQTEILTDQGWKHFKNLDKTEKVATLNPVNGCLEYQKVDKYIEYYWEGELLMVENQQVNFAVKPGHNLYLKKQRGNFGLYKAKDVYGLTHLEFKKDCQWEGEDLKYWLIPAFEVSWEVARPQWIKKLIRKQLYSQKYDEKQVEAKYFLEFLGLFIAEGCVSKQHSNWPNVVRLGQNKGKVFDRILFLLNKLHWDYKIYPNYQGGKCYEIRLYNTQLATYLGNLCGFGAKDKKVPPDILKLSSSLLKNLFNGLMLGDGEKAGRYFSTNSPQLKDNFEELLLKIGLVGRVKLIKGHDFISPNGKKYLNQDTYHITINYRNLTPRINKRDWRKVSYKGQVYCVSVPNRIIYVRRNNCALWSGNCIILDERDRFIQEHVPYIDKRLLHSDLKWRREASTPTFPGKGVNQTYLESDQRVWMLKCEECELEQELDFFFNVDFEKKITICKQCKAPIDRLKEGRWVALNPEEKEIHGYKISGIHNPRRSVEELVNSYEKARISGFSAMQQFYNQVLGLPYEAEGKTLLVSELTNCSQNYLAPLATTGCLAGADVGEVIHVIVSKRIEGKLRYVYIGMVSDFLGPIDSIESLMEKYQIQMLIIDAKPETRKVRELIEKYPNRVMAVYYPTRKFDVQNYYVFDEYKAEVYIDRTISLDYLISDIQNEKIAIPSNAKDIPDFFQQMTSSVRITEVNPRTGQPVARWIEKGPDHFLHAANYNRIALLKGSVGQALLNSYTQEKEIQPNSIAGWANLVRTKGVILG